MIPLIPLYLRYDRFLKMRAFRYKTKELSQALRELSSPEFDEIKQANLIDCLTRKVFTLSTNEFNFMLVQLNKVGGFSQPADFLYVFQILKKYMADYEYYKEWKFNTEQELKSYLNSLHYFVKELTSKFLKDPNCIKFGAEFAERSSPFWSEQILKFDLSNFMWLSQSITNLNKIIPVQAIDTIKAHLVKQLPEITNSTDKMQVQTLLEINKSLHILSENKIEELTKKVELMKDSSN